MTLRIAFMGTPDFALPTLKALVDAGYNVVSVYSQPPRPKGRGHQVQPSPVHAWAEAQNIPVRTPKTLRDADAQGEFQALQLDFAVVVAYGLILPKAILEAPRYGCVNVHGSLLPRWRGAAPIQRAILESDDLTGITTMLMDEGLDTGPMLMTKTCPIDAQTTASVLHDQLAQFGADLIVPTLQGLVTGTLIPLPQPEDGVTYASKLQRDEGIMDWTRSAKALQRKVNALNPWPGTYFLYQDTPFKIHGSEIIPDMTGKPGVVLDSQLTIACGQGALRITKIQRPNGPVLSARDFLNGFALPEGTSLIK